MQYRRIMIYPYNYIARYASVRSPQGFCFCYQQDRGTPQREASHSIMINVSCARALARAIRLAGKLKITRFSKFAGIEICFLRFSYGSSLSLSLSVIFASNDFKSCGFSIAGSHLVRNMFNYYHYSDLFYVDTCDQPPNLSSSSLWLKPKLTILTQHHHNHTPIQSAGQ